MGAVLIQFRIYLHAHADTVERAIGRMFRAARIAARALGHFREPALGPAFNSEYCWSEPLESRVVTMRQRLRERPVTILFARQHM
jgi:hypothetical protein